MISTHLINYKNSMITLILGASIALSGCAGAPRSQSQANECQHGLTQAYKELDAAKAKGFSGAADYTKAASLLTAAKIQQQFNKYPNCINKVKRARYYIEESVR